ncbi:MAG: DUF1573 domain-containing protein [Bacteroidales bacterium]|nr:DUF1573 domain-containing protein [Bacteroidales bacterium]MBN2817470.1 DUF1573 domain-containing protein [Bacteroidales bacterium]
MKRLFTFTILAAMTFAISCSQTNTSEESANIDAQGPIIEFKDLVHDYGTIKQGEDGNCEFVFTNNGAESLVLSNVRSSCGCTVPSWPREAIAPGESSAIKVKYDTRRIGPISKTITVTSNGSERPVILRITGKVEPAETAAAPSAEAK